MKTILACAVSESGLPQLSIENNVATLTLCRPDAANRLEPDDIQEIHRHIKTVNESEVMVLRIQGSGKYFCSGFDISKMQPGVKNSGFEALVDALESCRPVTVAVLNGGVYGGATDLALSCDFRVGAGNVEMFMPAARLGLHFYRTGLQRYVSRLGLNHAKRLFLKAEKLDAKAMADCGFITDLVAEDEIASHVEAMTETIAALAPLSVLSMKKHLNRIAAGQLDAQELQSDIERAAKSADIKEGALAWKEKRKAQFRGV